MNFSIAFYLQTDGQLERTIRTLEDMLRACVLEFQGSWDEHLPLVEFANNNNSIQVLECHLMRFYVGDHVDRRYFGKRLKIGLY